MNNKNIKLEPDFSVAVAKIWRKCRDNGFSLVLYTVILLSCSLQTQADTIGTPEKMGLPLQRTITDTQGRVIEATIIAVGDGKVSFKRNGEQHVFTIPLDTLSEESQTFLRENVDPTKRNAAGPRVLLVRSTRTTMSPYQVTMLEEKNIQFTHISKPPEISWEETLKNFDAIIIISFMPLGEEKTIELVNAGNKLELPIAISEPMGISQKIRDFFNENRLDLPPNIGRGRGQMRIRGNIIRFEDYHSTRPRGNVPGERGNCKETYEKVVTELLRMIR